MRKTQVSYCGQLLLVKYTILEHDVCEVLNIPYIYRFLTTCRFLEEPEGLMTAHKIDELTVFCAVAHNMIWNIINKVLICGTDEFPCSAKPVG
jgi:hypothetical protein